MRPFFRSRRTRDRRGDGGYPGNRHRSLKASVAILGLLVLSAPGACSPSSRLKSIRLPPGYSIAMYADGLPGARSLAIGERGTVFVGTRGEGKVYAVVDRDGDRKADNVIVVADGLDSPNGVAFRNGSLYVAEIGRILRFDRIESRLGSPGRPAVVYDGFPRDRLHGWKFIAFGPDGLLYVPVGAPCNVCEPPGPAYAAIHRMRPDGSGLETFARGVRNTVGFDWDPETGDLWFTDNGRDWLGDDLPPDELNHAPGPGLHFGFPYRHGNGIPDPEFGDRGNGRTFVPPAIALGPHVAALGMRFYRGGMFPGGDGKRIFIAEHGSWNRSTPIGYRVSVVTVRDGKATGYDVFAEGWLSGGRAWGRPVDVLELPDGSLLVSDDRAGAIYRISHGPGAPGRPGSPVPRGDGKKPLTEGAGSALGWQARNHPRKGGDEGEKGAAVPCAGDSAGGDGARLQAPSGKGDPDRTHHAAFG